MGVRHMPKRSRFRTIGNIVYLNHRRTSRAAKSASLSAVKPLSLAVEVDRIADHQSAGTLLRCFHLRAANLPAPISQAMASGEGHSPITDLNELILDIAPTIRQSVLIRKPKMSRDEILSFWDNLGMAGKLSDKEQIRAFIARTRQARRARYQEQGPICLLLDVPQTTYTKYETRTPLPHRYIPKFCAATGATYVWLLAGEGDAPAQVVPLKQDKPRKPRKNKGTKAA